MFSLLYVMVLILILVAIWVFSVTHYYTHTKIIINEPAYKYYAVRFCNTCGFKEA